MPASSYYMDELSDGFIFASGSGSQIKHAPPQYERLKRQLGIIPRDPLNYMYLLAEINREIAQSDKRNSVSPFCQVTFLNADDRFGPVSRAFIKSDESVPFSIPIVAYGIDMDELTHQFFPDFENLFKGDDLPPSEININRLKRKP